ncbi:MAG: S53 family peptidase [Candidatus Dormibacteria bacterium]
MVTLRDGIAAAAALSLLAVASPVLNAGARGPIPGDSASAAGQSHHEVCGQVAAGFARCHSQVLDSTKPGKPPGGGGGSTCAAFPGGGYLPADLRSAYNLSAVIGNGTGETVAIVDAYDDPNALSDVGCYRQAFAIPALNSGSGPTFTKVNQSGGSSYPRANGSWSQEISLDLDMVSAVCPHCNILLVEANSNSFSNLAAAAAYAGGAAGVVAESNSYGGGESSGETSYDSSYNHPGVAVTASSGDSGYGAEYPAASPVVTAVGGTSLANSCTGVGIASTSAVRGCWSETVWSGAGSGCSLYEAQPSWQASNTNVPSVCGKRAIADVAADADPNTGVAVYDTFHTSGWLVFGGTSVASPLVASIYALAGNTSTASNFTGPNGAQSGGGYPYSHASSLYDPTAGSNGSCGTLLCNAAIGWDGPTGVGTADGIGGF